MSIMKSLRTIFLASVALAIPASAFAGIFVSVNIAPPVLPVYVQPVCPGDGYLWTPGYWAYGDAGYYWVPGTWVLAPQPGFLWTPGYWGFAGGAYLWHAGYWGPHVGFYGGVNYGYGYGGVGFYGGRWEGGHFAYNTAVLHVNTTVIHNTYVDNTVIHNTTVVNRTSFNGPGGIQARPSGQEIAAAREQHFQPTSEQVSHQNFAAENRGNLASVNGGRPATGAVSHPFTNANMARASFNAPVNNNRAVYNGAANQQHFNAPQNNQQHFNAASQNNQQHVSAPQSNQQHFNAPPQSQAHYNVAPQNQARYNAPQNSPQHYNPPPQHQGGAPAPRGGEPHGGGGRER